MKKTIAIMTSAGLMIGLSSAADADICTRHFYNNSKYVWAVLLSFPSHCGNSSIVSKTGCQVQPHQVVTLHYNSPAAGPIFIRSLWYSHAFVTTVPCRIQHNGGTGPVSVNDPANGDVSTCGIGSYHC